MNTKMIKLTRCADCPHYEDLDDFDWDSPNPPPLGPECAITGGAILHSAYTDPIPDWCPLEDYYEVYT